MPRMATNDDGTVWLEGRRSRCRSACIGRQHLIEKLVGHATFDELLLGQHTVMILVHLVEDLLCPAVGRVVRVDIR